MGATDIKWADRVWRQIPSWPNYEVSNDGLVRNARTLLVLKLQASASGHLYFIASRGRKCYVHRAVLEAFVGPCPVGSEARHMNGQQADNRPENLAWGTRYEQRDDDRRNRVVRRPKQTRLNAESAEQIRRALRLGQSVRSLARWFKVSHTTVIAVRDGRLWRIA